MTPPSRLLTVRWWPNSQQHYHVHNNSCSQIHHQLCVFLSLFGKEGRWRVWSAGLFTKCVWLTRNWTGTDKFKAVIRRHLCGRGIVDSQFINNNIYSINKQMVVHYLICGVLYIYLNHIVPLCCHFATNTFCICWVFHPEGNLQYNECMCMHQEKHVRKMAVGLYSRLPPAESAVCYSAPAV